MDIYSEIQIIQIQASPLAKIERLRMLSQELSDLIDRAISYYYDGSIICMTMEQNYPYWKSEAQEIVNNAEHRIYDLCSTHEVLREDIHEIAKIECQIASATADLELVNLELNISENS